MQTASKWNFRT